MAQQADSQNNKLCTFTFNIIICAVLTYFFQKYTFNNPDIFPCVANDSQIPQYGGGPAYTDVT